MNDEFVTTAEAVERLAPDVTADMVYDWVRRGLVEQAGKRPGGESYYRWADLLRAEKATRESGRGRKRAADQRASLSNERRDVTLASISGRSPQVAAAQNRRRCTIERPDRKPCGFLVDDSAPITACTQHIRQASDWLAGKVERIRSGAYRRNEGRHSDYIPPADKPEFVYYIRIANQIKIGWTTDLKQRFSSIGGEELLATEPGGFQLEQMRHKQFGSARIYRNREWFRPEPDLMSHIDMLVKHFGEARVA